MKKVLKSILVCAALIATQFSFAQTSSTTIAEAAPNLPAIVRYDNTGDKYYGANHEYKKEENETKLKEWATNFPAEVEAYKTAIESYLKTDYSTLSDNEKETYDDLKSQWLMFSQL